MLQGNEEIKCPMVLYFDGRYRSLIECNFLEQVEEELTKFWSTCSDNSVLVFPPLSARYRYLIHQLVGAGARLQTVSVGQGRQRRTVVYCASERYLTFNDLLPFIAANETAKKSTHFQSHSQRESFSLKKSISYLFLIIFYKFEN